jgi:hypothetical protein
MFKRYVDLFTEDERRARQRKVQERRQMRRRDTIQDSGFVGKANFGIRLREFV